MGYSSKICKRYESRSRLQQLINMHRHLLKHAADKRLHRMQLRKLLCKSVTERPLHASSAPVQPKSSQQCDAAGCFGCYPRGQSGGEALRPFSWAVRSELAGSPRLACPAQTRYTHNEKVMLTPAWEGPGAQHRLQRVPACHQCRMGLAVVGRWPDNLVPCGVWETAPINVLGRHVR